MPAIAGAFEELPALVELAYALRPPSHEGDDPSYGAILLDGPLDPAVLALGPLDHELVPIDDVDPAVARRFADGSRTFVVRHREGIATLLCFGRAMAREYDLVILQRLLGGLVVQRHPTGQVRTYGPAGVVRWNGIAWYHEPPIEDMLAALGDAVAGIPEADLRLLLLFATHELSPRRIGAILIWRPGSEEPHTRWERRHHRAPRVGLAHPGGTAAIANAVAQTDGAAVFAPGCHLAALGVRLVPSPASHHIDLIGGTRHTSALRYSFDDPDALVIVVSDDGPVTVMRRGEAVGITRHDDRIG